MGEHQCSSIRLTCCNGDITHRHPPTRCSLFIQTSIQCDTAQCAVGCPPDLCFILLLPTHVPLHIKAFLLILAKQLPIGFFIIIIF